MGVSPASEEVILQKVYADLGPLCGTRMVQDRRPSCCVTILTKLNPKKVFIMRHGFSHEGDCHMSMAAMGIDHPPGCPMHPVLNNIWKQSKSIFYNCNLKKSSSAFVLAKYHARVMPSKTKGIGQCNPYVPLLFYQRHNAQIYLLLRIF